MRIDLRCPTSTAAFLILAVSGGAGTARAEDVWLSRLDLGRMSSGWGRPQADRSVQEKPLSIGGRRFERGVGTHAASAIHVDLKGKGVKFEALVGVDDEVGAQRGSIRFRLVGPARTLWKSEVMRGGDPAKEVKVDLRGIESVVLLVEDAGDGVDFDHADWAEARFEVVGARPEAVPIPPEERVVLTPRPPREPRVNGARVFGVRPGSPFLFTIPATGDRPMSFAADGLPEGLKVDLATGRIGGSLKEKGEWTVTLRATNSRGTGERKLRIVCGEGLALTPHMGWNHWYIWEGRVTDRIIRDAADAMVSSGLIDHGYTYVNIDDCWSVKPGSSDPSIGGEPRDTQGRINSNRRFPDMLALTDHIHGKGLKAGIYTSPGALTCAGFTAALGHEEADVRRYAEWGFDFLKHDWCSYGEVAKGGTLEELKKPYRLVSELLRKQDRDIVLNLCQYGMGKVWEWGKEVGGQSWRTAGDLGGSFEGIGAAIFRDGFDVYSRNELHRFGGPGAWNDPDYLLLGFIGNWRGGSAPSPLTPNEQYTQVSLWSLVAAPLIYSGDITRLDDFTLGLLANDEVIDVDQDPLGRPGRRVSAEDDLEVWARELEDGSKAVGLFNRGELASPVTARWSDLGISGKRRVRDLWRQEDRGAFEGSFQAPVARHGVVLVRLYPLNG